MTVINFACLLITAPLENAPCDRILSIGALEHVRPQELKQLYQKIYDVLAAKEAKSNPVKFTIHYRY
jgi:cyclopropane fatty-acyl-phospholipid synthase-like methyltransferase